MAQQLQALMQSVADLCQKLGGTTAPAPPPAPVPAPAPAAEANAPVLEAAAAAASATQGSTSTSCSSSASGADASAVVAGGPAQAPPTAAPAAVQLAQHGAAEDCIASAAPLAAAAVTAGTSFFIGSDGDQPAMAMAAGGGIVDGGGGDAGGDDDIYLSGSEAESTFSARDMDVQSMAAITPEQRERVREALGRRRQQHRANKKLKKQLDEQCKGVAGDAKKPNK